MCKSSPVNVDVESNLGGKVKWYSTQVNDEVKWGDDEVKLMLKLSQVMLKYKSNDWSEVK